MSPRKSEKPELSRLELFVMDRIWESGEASSAEIVDAVRAMRKLAPTTIRTVIANLKKKGYVEQVPSLERGFRFRPIVSRDAVAKRSLRDLFASMFQGSPRQAIAFMLREDELSQSDVAELRRMLDEKRSRGGKS